MKFELTRMRVGIPFFLTILITLLVHASFADDERGKTFIVSCDDGKSLQRAIDRSRAGDVLIVTGTCHENLVISERHHEISLDGQGTATIDGPDPNRNVVSVRGKGITIKGFTITGGRAGIRLNNGKALIESNTIINTGHGGIIVGFLSFAVIADNTIQNTGRNGIQIAQNSHADIGFRDSVPGQNIIVDNNRHGIDVQHSSSAMIGGNVIKNNGRSGIRVRKLSHAEITSNEISNNARDGIRVQGNSEVEMGDDIGDVIDGPNFTVFNNAEFGLRCDTGSIVEGPIGSLNGWLGQSDFDSTSIDLTE